MEKKKFLSIDFLQPFYTFFTLVLKEIKSVLLVTNSLQIEIGNKFYAIVVFTQPHLTVQHKLSLNVIS